MGVLLDDGWTELLLALSLLLVVLYRHVTSSFDYWARRGVPYLKPLPLFGNIRDIVLMRKANSEVFHQLYKEGAPHRAVGFFFQCKPALLVRDPELVKSVLIKDFPHFASRFQMPDQTKNPLATNLFHVGSRLWRPLRSKLSPTFSSGRIKAMFPLLAECAAQLQGATDAVVDAAGQAGAVLDVREALAQFSTDVIGTCAFGLQCKALQSPDSMFRKVGRQIFTTKKSVALRRFFYGAFPFLQNRKVDTSSSSLGGFFLELVRQTVDERLEKGIKRSDFLDLLIQLKQKGHLDGDPSSFIPTEESVDFTHEIMTAQCFVFFAAGFETSSTTMSFTLYELALHQNIQERLRKEIDYVLKKHGENLSYDAIQEMTYLDQVVSETLRIYPPLSWLDRVCEVPYKLPGTKAIIEPQTRVFIPIIGLHKDPQYFPEPEKFDPERFSKENSERINKSAYLPFGDGPRNCIGMRFGLLQTKVGLVSMLRRYLFEPSEQTAVPLKMAPVNFITTPVGGISLRLRRR